MSRNTLFILLPILLLLASCGVWEQSPIIDAHDSRSAPLAEKYEGPMPSGGMGSAPIRYFADSALSAVDRVPLDPSIMRDTYSNGLLWYAHAFSEASGDLDLALVFRVGSVYEPDEYLGLMHVLAHLMRQSLHGLPLGRGAHLEEEVTYSSFQVRLHLNASAATRRRVLAALGELAASPEWTSTQIDQAKRAALSCTDLRHTSILHTHAEVLYPESRYARHTPYFKGNSLLYIPDDTLNAFSRHWIRPDNGALVVQGDMEGANIASVVERIPRGQGELHRPHYRAPLHRPLYVGILPTDSPANLLYWIQHRPHQPLLTRRAVLREFPNKLIPILWQITVAERIPVARLVHNEILRGVDGLDTWIMKWKIAGDKPLLGLVREIEALHMDIKKSGFNPEEIALAKRRFLDAIHSDKASTRGDCLRTCARNFLYDTPLLSSAQEYEMAETALSKITEKDLRRAFLRGFSKRNRTVILTGVEAALPTEVEVRSILPK